MSGWGQQQERSEWHGWGVHAAPASRDRVAGAGLEPRSVLGSSTREGLEPSGWDWQAAEAEPALEVVVLGLVH